MADYLNMQAGREMDSLIVKWLLKKTIRGFPKPYSTDIAAAWEVWGMLEHLHPQISYDDTLCCYTFKFNNGPEDFGSIDAIMGRINFIREDTAPLAICRAALMVAAPSHAQEEE